MDHDLTARIEALTIQDRHRLARRSQRARTAGDRETLMTALADAEAKKQSRSSSVPQLSYPVLLPVTDKRDEIMAAISQHQVVVVAGATGSGKTTQIPKMCLELGRGVDGMIGHTQPRRIAARTVAERLAEEMDVTLGRQVGYAVRFDDRVGPETLVKVMTDGVLLAETRRDPLLLGYDTIIVDEAHERSLNIDFLLGYLLRLVPKRPDLKVVITSATIDTERFAAHFGAPVVEVSGRTYPVEIRYRPPSDDDDGEEDGAGDARNADIGQAICAAVDELVADGPGDILVFLPGERDIRDTADALRRHGCDDLEIFTLYARLSAAEQHAVFRPHDRRRVVLATNVAETSLTVPGITSVIDTGLARISRFSHRTKVQRLPIEAVSQASANQRAGRCGRVAPGICIRLYSEEDFEGRPAFTDPEILRTNLASVILQMATTGLGEIEDFPFMEPPDRRSVADGMALLEELGAIERRDGELKVTRLGRKLAELPLDPRLGRMIVEAEQRHCLREVTVIVAALSIQDPRERPIDKAAAADESHRRFADTDSDFVSYLKLWDHLSQLQAELSGNQFRKRCRAEFLNVLRVREWQDLASQIRQTYRSRGVHANREPAPPDQIHQALLAGLLSHVGVHDRARGDYQGARNTRWQIGRSSALAKRRPAWVMAASLVETETTWARTAARIEPSWAERLGSHQTKRSYSDPWWDPVRGEAMSDERVTLYGLTLVAKRPVRLSGSDPVAARDMFIRHGLVERDWEASGQLSFLDLLDRRVDQVIALEARIRRGGLVADEDTLCEFFDQRIPPDILSGRGFLRWWRRARAATPDLLDVPLEVVLDQRIGSVDLSSYPHSWPVEDLDLPLRYVFDPGSPDDGVTVEVPLASMNRIDARPFQWHVPGHRQELTAALIRSLPKSVRRAVGPAPQAAAEVLAGAGPEDGPFLEVMADRLARLTGEPVSASQWDLELLPEHLRINFDVVDADGKLRGRGRDFEGLRHQLAREIRAAVSAAAPALSRRGATGWEFGDIPRRVDHGAVRGYPALVDEGETVGLIVTDSPAAQADGMWLGTRRLLLLGAPVQSSHLQRRLTKETTLALARSGRPVADLLYDCARAVAEDILVAHGGPSFEQTGFEAMLAKARRSMPERVPRVATIAGGVLALAGEVADRTESLQRRHPISALRPALDDISAQVARLVQPGFVTSAGTSRLGDCLRYMDAALQRLDRLPADHQRDARRQATVGRVQAHYDQLLDQVVAGRAAPGVAAKLADVRWMIEELRVSLWAQSLGTPQPVSEQRIIRVLSELSSGT